MRSPGRADRSQLTSLLVTSLYIPARYNGPASSANGGVAAGLLAEAFPAGATVEVTLREPPPLERELRIERDGDHASLIDGSLVVAQAWMVPAAEARTALGGQLLPVDYGDAVAAAARYDGRHDHPFPTCFVCGPQRPLADGLGLSAGPLDPADPRRVATPFVPPDDVDTDRILVWAALDCPGGWSIGLVGRRAVLGRMTARISEVPAVGERCVVVGRCDGWDGRKAFSRTSAYGQDGRLLGVASAVWIELA
jgi:hypothetical protein